MDASGTAFARERFPVEILHESPRDGSEDDKWVVSVILDSQIVPGCTHRSARFRRRDTVRAIAQQHYGDGNFRHRPVDMKPGITDPDILRTGDIVREHSCAKSTCA